MGQIFRQILPDTPALPDSVLAPMSGITDRPFRRAVRRAGGGLVVSEMIASHAVLSQIAPELAKMRFSAEEEAPLSIQLAGHDPAIMAEAAKMAEQLGASMIDINLGCPAKKVTGRMAGSALMAEPERAGQIFSAVRQAVRCPVSVKMRLGVDEHHMNAAEIATIAEQAGLCMVTIHARTRAQMYKGAARWHLAAEAVSSLCLPVLINGDICNAQDAEKALSQSGAAGIMVGRAAQGQPWLLGAIEADMAGDKTFQLPDSALRHEYIVTHLDEMMTQYGSRGLKLARKHLASYCDYLPRSEQLRTLMMRADQVGQIFAALHDYFSDADVAA